ncbi:TetR/AcrR family transcriptional regulator C-terminal domain-containing protein [Amycolatopsis suaedae]|uniref:GntR family transcriptional regulator n=1 Tax=Amycolatopsis suaedae TaxID=2510978 RepID=A0A4Q7J4G0_9PSEU|nr:TetR/AcrR family transcriptional regulator C-terminal domain-containing protein [Amycolatopsis suaedae]RZQ61698.1 GntR family transcriptional regulator [Amycolatopsis suaedae]
MTPSEEIVAELRRRITRGELLPGDRVPSTREITRDWGVAMATATRVLASLRQLGLVRMVPGVGTVVVEGPAARSVRRRAPQGEVTGERVVRTAMAIADTEGLRALSMRRVAAELGLAPMTLYRHVPSRNELHLRMADTAFGDQPPGAATGTPRERLEQVLRGQWRIYRRHPWLAQVLSLTRPQPLQNLLDHGEVTLAVLAGFGLSAAARLNTQIALFGWVRAVALNLAAEADEREDTGLTEDEWAARSQPEFTRILAQGRHPAYAALFAEFAETGYDLDLDEVFELGLQRMLDGLLLSLGGGKKPVG